MTTQNPQIKRIGQDHNIVYQRNLQILRLLDPQLHARVAAVQLPNSVAIEPVFGTNNAVQSVRVTMSDGHHFYPCRPGNLSKEDQAFFSKTTSMTVFCLIGTENVDLFFYLFERSIDIGELKHLKQVPFYVLEPDINAFVILLCLYDMRKIFTSSRVKFFIGEKCINDYLDFLSISDRQKPAYIMSPNSRIELKQGVIDGITELQDRQTKSLENLMESCAQRYDSPERQLEIKQAFQNQGRPLRAMFFTSRYTSFLQYGTANLANGFSLMGCEVQVVKETDTLSEYNMLFMLEKIDQFDPDLIMMIDHFRWEYPHLPQSIPFGTWVQDLLPQMFRDDQGPLGPHDHVFSFSKKWIRTKRLSGPMFGDRPIHYLPVGVDTEVIRPLPDVKKDIDVLYVSNLPLSDHTLDPFRNKDTLYEYTLFKNEREALDNNAITVEQMVILYTLIVEELEKISYLEAFELEHNLVRKRLFAKQLLELLEIKDVESCMGLFVDNNQTRIGWDIFRKLKLTPARHLAEQGINIHIYGSNWETFPEIADHCHGIVQNGDPLNRLTARSRICIHNSGTTLHMRSMEILGAGGFLMCKQTDPTIDNTAITDFFEDGKDMVLWNNEQELLEHVRHYLDNPDARERIARQGFESCMKQFTYDRLAQQVRETIRKDLSQLEA
ncbi:MAG: glycosyltransferase [Magnetococcales bacterium]|nr:glycosyltransferase [Magnetococcales bacterium]